MGRKAGLSDEKLLAVRGNDLAVFSDAERLLIELADAMVTAPANISDDLYQGLREHFSEEQLLELASRIAFENYRARLNRVFDVESDQLYVPGSGKAVAAWRAVPASIQPCAMNTADHCTEPM